MDRPYTEAEEWSTDSSEQGEFLGGSHHAPYQAGMQPWAPSHTSKGVSHSASLWYPTKQGWAPLLCAAPGGGTRSGATEAPTHKGVPTHTSKGVPLFFNPWLLTKQEDEQLDCKQHLQAEGLWNALLMLRTKACKALKACGKKQQDEGPKRAPCTRCYYAHAACKALDARALPL
eukprot:scaffold91925_cov23-Tisochrysis_lutea.AAC.1